jgi:uncharacterized membrane protein YgdD (TMEM256/DUF423 family)
MQQEQGVPINVSSIQANEALQSIKQNQEEFGRKMAAALTGPILMLWGLMVFCGYMGAHFFPAYEIWIWIAVAFIGYAGTTFFLFYHCRQKVRVKNEASKKHITKIYLVWISIVGYGVLCMYVLSPPTGFHTQAQIKTHMAIIPMLCWFLIGVLEEDKRAKGYSLIIMTLILLGFYVFSGDINVWLAFVVAAPLFLIGLRPYLKWR